MLLNDMTNLTKGLVELQGKAIINKAEGWSMHGELELKESTKIQIRHSELGVYFVREFDGIHEFIDEDIENKTITIESIKSLNNIEEFLKYADMLVIRSNKNLAEHKSIKTYLVTLFRSLVSLAKLGNSVSIIDYVGTNFIGIKYYDKLVRLYNKSTIVKDLGNYAIDKIQLVVEDRATMFILENDGVYSLIHLTEDDYKIIGLGDTVDVIWAVYNCFIIKVKRTKVMFIVLDGKLYYRGIDYFDNTVEYDYSIVSSATIQLMDKVTINLDDVELYRNSMDLIRIEGLDVYTKYLGSHTWIEDGDELYIDNYIRIGGVKEL